MQFTELPLTDTLLEGLDAMNFKETTPVQEQAIPVLLKGKDVIACAQTGTGKTAAFLLPLLNNLQTDNHEENKVNAIIMAPTRELAQQIDQMMEGFSYYTPFTSVAVYGGNDGEAWDVQKKGLQNGSDVVIATPGRLLSHINLYNIDFSGVKYFILDEADRMLDMGFYDDIMKIVKLLPKERQTVMFSATMPQKIQQMAKSILINPEEISIAVAKPPESIIQSSYICYESQKIEILKHLFEKKRPHKVILFSGKKQKVKEISKTLYKMNLSVGEMHSDLDQAQREHIMHEFKNERVDILVATDIVARGIDIDDITLVINFDVPYDVEDYVHRIGRTARAGDSGMAITFVSPEEQYLFEQIEQFLQKKIYKIPVPAELGETPEYNPDKYRRQRGEKRNSTRRKIPAKTEVRAKLNRPKRSAKGEKNPKVKERGKEIQNNKKSENSIKTSDVNTTKNKSYKKPRQAEKQLDSSQSKETMKHKGKVERGKASNQPVQNDNKPVTSKKKNLVTSKEEKPITSKGKKLVKKKRDFNNPEISTTQHPSKERINTSNEAGAPKRKIVTRKNEAGAPKSEAITRKNETVRQTKETGKKKRWSWWPFGKK